AVAALTRDAAEIAGLSKRLGTIEPGKLGHLVAMTGPYGGETSKPRYVLADGLKFDLEKETPAAKGKGFGGRGGGFRKGASIEEKPDAEAPGEEPSTRKEANEPTEKAKGKARRKTAEASPDAKPESPKQGSPAKDQPAGK